MLRTVQKLSLQIGQSPLQFPAEWAAGLPSTALEEAWGVTIYSDNKSALQATAKPRHQSGQRLIKRTMGAIEKALASGRRLHLAWIGAILFHRREHPGNNILCDDPSWPPNKTFPIG
jgi:hypothetical protein